MFTKYYILIARLTVVNKHGRPLLADGLVTRKKETPPRLFKRAYGFAALYADGADVNGLGSPVQRQLLLMKVGPEDPFAGLVGMAVRFPADRLFSAKFAFIRHGFIIAN